MLGGYIATIAYAVSAVFVIALVITAIVLLTRRSRLDRSGD